MKPLLVFFVTFTAASTMLGCAPGLLLKEPPPFRIPQQVFRDKIKTIVVERCSVLKPMPKQAPEPDIVMARFESQIAAQLRQAGLSVVPASEFVRIWNSAGERVGGNPGERRTLTPRELKATFNADASLWCLISPHDLQGGTFQSLLLLLSINDMDGILLYTLATVIQKWPSPGEEVFPSDKNMEAVKSALEPLVQLYK